MAKAEGRLEAVSLRDTFARQSGMYAVVKNLDDEQVRDLVHGVCGGCVRERIWKVAGEGNYPSTKRTSDELPIYCAEGCNYLVAAGLRMLKK